MSEHELLNKIIELTRENERLKLELEKYSKQEKQGTNTKKKLKKNLFVRNQDYQQKGSPFLIPSSHNILSI